MSTIKFEVIPYGSGWEDYVLTVDGKEYVMFTTCIYATYYLDDLLEALCYMSPDYYRFTEYGCYTDNNCCIEPDITIRTDKEGNMRAQIEEVNYKSNESLHGINSILPREVHLVWDGEGRHTNWKIIRSASIDNDFELHVNITAVGYDMNEADFCISYKDFVKVISDGCLTALKKHGFLGWAKSNYNHTLDLSKIVFLKAIANDRLADLSIENEEERIKPCSSFEQEMDILFM